MPPFNLHKKALCDIITFAKNDLNTKDSSINSQTQNDIIEHNNKMLDEAELNELKTDVIKLKKAINSLKDEIADIKKALSWKADSTHRH